MNQMNLDDGEPVHTVPGIITILHGACPGHYEIFSLHGACPEHHKTLRPDKSRRRMIRGKWVRMTGSEGFRGRMTIREDVRRIRREGFGNPE